MESLSLYLDGTIQFTRQISGLRYDSNSEVSPFRIFYFNLVPPVSGVGQNIAVHASSAAGNSAFLASAFLVHSTSFYLQSSSAKVIYVMNSEPDLYL